MTPAGDHVRTDSNFKAYDGHRAAAEHCIAMFQNVPGRRDAFVSHIAGEALTVRIDIGYAEPVQGEACRVAGNVAGGEVNIPDA